MRIIGITGLKRAGKDTAADALVSGAFYQKLALADPLRQAAFALDPIVGPKSGTRFSDAVGGPDFTRYEDAKDLYPEVRRVLQRLGTEVGRDLFGEDFWTKQLVSRIEAVLRERGGHGRVVVPDVRFKNEAEALLELADTYPSAVRVRIIRIERFRRPEPGADVHASEAGVDDVPVNRTFINKGTVSQLQRQLLSYERMVFGA